MDPLDRCDHCRRKSEYYAEYRPSVARVPNMARGKLSLARGIHYDHSLFLFPDEHFYIVKNMYRPTCMHISD